MILYRQWLLIFKGLHKNILYLSENKDGTKEKVMLMEC